MSIFRPDTDPPPATTSHDQRLIIACRHLTQAHLKGCLKCHRGIARKIASDQLNRLTVPSQLIHVNSISYQLVGGWGKTPLKNMSSSIGMMTFAIYGKIKVMFQSPPTSQSLVSQALENIHETSMIFGKKNSGTMIFVVQVAILRPPGVRTRNGRSARASRARPGAAVFNAVSAVAGYVSRTDLAFLLTQ